MKKLLTLWLLIFGMAGAESVILNTFNAGELSPHLDSRVDFAKYQSGLRTMENFVVLPYGGAVKRSGTQYIADAKSNAVCRLAPFSVGVDQSYIMEMGGGYIRFYEDGVQLTDTSGVPIEVSTLYTTNDVFEVQMAQFADTIYFVHPEYPPYKLQRTTTTPTFTCAPVVWMWPPLGDENLTDITISPSATTGSITLTSSTNLFSTNDVGASWVLKNARTDGFITASLANSFTSSPLRVEGEWNLKTGGKWTGTLKIQVSEDGKNTWGDFRSYLSDVGAEANYDRDGTELEAGVYYRLLFLENASAAGTVRFQNDSAYLSGWVTITNYLSATQVQAVVYSELGSTTATKLWSEAAFSEKRGYPKTVAFYENRLFFGGTPYQVNTIWASMSDDYQNFKTGEFPDNSLRLSINSDNVIEWLLGRNALFVGTLGDEWILSGGDSATPITPTTVSAKRQTGFGSQTGVNALLASDSLFYLQRGGRKLREFEYSLETDSYKSQDAMMLAEHISKGKIIQVAEQQQPEPIIWCVRGDGQLVGMTYSKAQNVYGWHRQITDGEFESVAVIPSIGEDRVYVVVKRDNGRFIEWFTPFDWGADDNAWFVDSGLEFDGGSSVAITDITLGTNQWVIVGQTRVPMEYDWNGTIYQDTLGGLRNYYFYFGGIPNLNQRWSIKSDPSTGDDPLYSDLSLSTNIPPHTNWYYYSNLDVGGGAKKTDGRFYQTGLTIYATNSFSNGNQILLNGTGGLIIESFGDGIFIATNCTATNFTLVYKDGSDVFAYGTYTNSITAQRVQKVFTNMTHLAGQTVNVFADGGVQPYAVVGTNGVLTIADYKNHVIAGLPYTSKLSPMYLDSVGPQGNSYGKTKQPYRVQFRVNKSGGFSYGSSTNAMSPISVRLPDLTAGSPVPFYSGDTLTKPINSSPSTAPEFWVISSEPLPLELLSMTIYLDIKELP